MTLVKALVSIASIAILTGNSIFVDTSAKDTNKKDRSMHKDSAINELNRDNIKSIKEQENHISSAEADLKEAIAEGKSISLIEASKQLTQKNPTLMAARSEVEMYQWLLTSKKLGWMPTVSFISSEDSTLEISNSNNKQITFQENSQESESMPGITAPKGLIEASNYKNSKQSVLFSPGLQIEWIFLDIPRQYEISEYSALLSSYQFIYINTLRLLLLSMQREYFASQRSMYLIEAYSELYEETKKVYDVVSKRYQDGLVSKAELAQTETQLYSVGISLLSQYDTFYSSTASLSQLTGSVTEVLLHPSTSLQKIGNWTMLLGKTIKNAKQNNEKSIAALQRAKSEESRSRFYKSTYLPKLSLLGILGYQGNDERNSYRNFALNQQNTYSRNSENTIGINLTWSIFDGGVNYANSRAAEKQRDYYTNTATADYQNAQAKAKANYYKMLMSNSSIDLSNSEIESAKTALKVSTVRYNVGISNITTLVQNLKQLSSAQSEYANSVYKYNSAMAGLYRWSSKFVQGESSEFITDADKVIQ